MAQHLIFFRDPKLVQQIKCNQFPECVMGTKLSQEVAGDVLLLPLDVPLGFSELMVSLELKTLGECIVSRNTFGLAA